MLLLSLWPPLPCNRDGHEPRRVAVTGGPGAGKAALREVVRRSLRRSFHEHVAVLPEAAGIPFSGGFPRRATEAARESARRAIYQVQITLI